LIPLSLRNRTFPDQRLDPAAEHGVQAPRIQLLVGFVKIAVLQQVLCSGVETGAQQMQRNI